MISSTISSITDAAAPASIPLLPSPCMLCNKLFQFFFFLHYTWKAETIIVSCDSEVVSLSNRRRESIKLVSGFSGCDASVLLDDTSSSLGEKSAFQNLGSLRGFEVIDSVKSKVEDVCPGVVSCADLLAVVARDASVAVGGPTWTVKLGRRDSMSASQSLLAESNLPRATDDLDDLISLFGSKGLSSKEMVALSGSHTIGQAQCITFRQRIYNETNIDAGFASTRRRRCSFTDGDSNVAPLDLVTPNSFDNNYYKNLIQKKGLLKTDQVLFNGGSTDNFVTEYSKDRSAFYRDFALAMIKMGDIDPLTGSSGQIRRNCRVTN
ncbi:hypothetical protein MRB53_014624 [Persea americana]|uniref:Uncharacterized protein n=1 Tax=Persea americana TaxID=3435 RepID=A0ACC2KBK2_PERAE|nr:hypothetical protein MRB53_014624 [Persea americana]